MLYKSSKQIMDRTTRELKPEFTFDTDGERMVWRQYFDDGAYNTRYFSRSQMCIILHVHYIEDKNPDRLQKLVDSGELYDYLTDLYDRVEDAVEEQKSLWVENDEKYRAIVVNDPVGAAGIVNMYEMQAREVVYGAMIYD